MPTTDELIGCKHNHSVALSGSEGDGYRETVWLCRDCGTFTVRTYKDGVSTQVDFYLVRDEDVKAAGIFAKHLAEEERAKVVASFQECLEGGWVFYFFLVNKPMPDPEEREGKQFVHQRYWFTHVDEDDMFLVEYITRVKNGVPDTQTLNRKSYDSYDKMLTDMESIAPFENWIEENDLPGELYA